MFKRIIAFVLPVCLPLFSMAQTDGCGTDYINQRFGEQHPERLAFREQMAEMIRVASFEPGTERNTLIIPTVVHVIHKGGPENISTAQIEDALRILNEDLRLINSDTSNIRPVFKPYAADFNVEFRLAKIDPQGNCTDGITRTFSPISYNADDMVKDNSTGGITPWPVNKYFNIWVVGRISLDDVSGVIGYAYFPSWGMSNNYGVVMDNKYMGSIGTAQGKDGRTLTHEVGHCLELYHTFQSGCGGSCANTGDRVCDTPPTASATYACSFALNSCNNDNSGPSVYPNDAPDMVENYMSYNQNFCQNMFTKGQKSRSDAVFQNTFVGQLVISQNNLATGTSNGFQAQACVLQPNFTSDKTAICAGDSIRFFDMTENGNPDVYAWEITGPETLLSNEPNPRFTFTTPGIYSVSLVVTNAAGNVTAQKSSYIRVSSLPDFSSWMFYDNMDQNPLASRWTAVNLNYGFAWEEKTLSSGNNSLFIANSQNSPDLLKHELFSPVYDLTQIATPRFRFKTAFATKIGSSSDNLKVYFSPNCGNTWILRYSKTGEALASIAPTSIPINPIYESMWQEWEMSVPELFAQSENFRVKFVYTTGGGNDFYLDDINIMGLSSITETEELSTVRVYPNPVSDVLNFDLTSITAESVNISLYDISGRRVYQNIFMGGNIHTVPVHSSRLSSGVYQSVIEYGNARKTFKIVITE